MYSEVNAAIGVENSFKINGEVHVMSIVKDSPKKRQEKHKDLEAKKQAVQAWKKSYIEALIGSLKPNGDVLEIGFGWGNAADCIQAHKPKSHTIIEMDPENAKRAKTWAAKHKNVTVIQNHWTKEVPKLGTFDAIFFNDYPLESQEEILKMVTPEEMAQASKKARDTLTFLQKEMNQVKVQFSDEAIDEFYQTVGQYRSQELPFFLQALRERGHISEQQYSRSIKKYVHDKPSQQPLANNPMIDCLKQCIAKHMKKGARFSSFLVNAATLYEYAPFFEHVISSPEVDYHEEIIPVKVGNFIPIESLVMKVTKA